MRRQKSFLLITVMLGMLLPAVDGFAGDPLEKLGRGIANIAFGPLEILIRPYDVNKDQGAIASLTYGVFKGIAFVVAREAVGVVDVVTFPMPLPGCMDDPEEKGWGYGPLMRPAWVIDTEHNAFNFFYEDTAVSK